MKLHIGCGRDYKKGWINCDISPEVKPDKIVDLEKNLSFKDNSVEQILANHILEHINNFAHLMHELHRICKKNAMIEIRTPFYSAWGQFNDPTHVRFLHHGLLIILKKAIIVMKLEQNQICLKLRKLE